MYFSWIFSFLGILIFVPTVLSNPKRFIGRTVARSGHGNPIKYRYETKYFTQKLDHMNAGDNRVFQQRYLINTDHWKREGPMFFYCGNEGDITWFSNNTGFVWEIASQFDAIVIFAEHRYYGKSLPFGKDSYKDTAHLNYLSSEQALADYAVLLQTLKETEYPTSGPVIAFGGSYGGMLAAWFRMKYPNVVLGSLAASAPIWMFSGLTPCNTTFVTITRDFHQANPNCSDNIQRSWSAAVRAGTAAGGLDWLSSTFRLCQPLKTGSDVEVLLEWLSGTWFNLAMVDYPYPANFLEPLPEWPIHATCKYLSMRFTDDHQLLQAVANSLQVYYNTTGEAACFNTSEESGPSLGTQGWDFQACTEIVFPFCSDGIHDMFYPDPWNYTAYSEGCFKQYGIRPRPNWAKTLYGGKDISSHSNIIFSNGLLDPWSGGGVLNNLTDSLVAVVIPNGAHHLDLRASNPADPEQLKASRRAEMQLIRQWITRYYARAAN